MKKECLRDSFIYLLIICIFVLLSSCETAPGEDKEQSAGSISLSRSQVSVKSDNSDSTTVTATVLDDTDTPMESVEVTFTATAGVISAASAYTDVTGKCEITFSAGTERSNQTVTITANVAGLSAAQIPIEITGSTIALDTDISDLVIGGIDTATLTVTVTDAGSYPIFQAPVTVSVDAGATGAATLSPSTGTTDVDGVMALVVTGTSPGSVTLSVEAAGATATQTYTVDSTVDVFRITSPAQDPYSLSTNTDLLIEVNAPAGVTTVVFATTVGYLNGVSNVVEIPVAGGVASATFISDVAGVATVQVYDKNNPLTTDSMQVVVAAPVSEASQIALQASTNVVAPSTGDTNYTVTLSATVKNSNDQPVGSAPVIFSIDNPTGGGETISPVIVYTNSSGVATSTFTSGSLSSDVGGVIVRAAVVGTTITSTVPIVIGGTAASLMIGSATTMTSINNNTAYQLAMSVMVADSNGNPVVDTPVSLKVWPTRYATGYITGSPCQVEYDELFNNEDNNGNLILDAGEDLNGDGQLTPPNSAAGTVPSTVTTDVNGVANFNLVYMKESAIWIEVQVTASTLVQGTETQSNYKFWLGYIVNELCSLPHSPYVSAPIANAGPDQAVDTGTLVTLDGSLSYDADSDTLTYSWSFVSVPALSFVTDSDLSDTSAETPTFTTDVNGDYLVQLVVNDGTMDSAPDTITITAAPAP